MIEAKNIFIVGIKGVAMTNLAVILKKMGKQVTGSDVDEEFITDELLKKNNIDWVTGFSPSDLPQETELLVYGAAHQGINNQQVIEAVKRKVKVLSQAEVLGRLTKLFETSIAVCGCHGKTTTAALLSYALINLGVKPSYLIGTSAFNGFDGGDYYPKARGSYFVVEADEYGVNPPVDKTPKFNFLRPRWIICTNIDYDHPDVYRNLDETKQAFSKFFYQSINRLNSAKIFICADDRNSIDAIKKIDRKNYFSFGFNPNADYRVKNFKTESQGSSFELEDPQKRIYKFNSFLFGEKNISDIAGVISLLLFLDFSYYQIKLAIKNFSGAKRRFEKIDYQHNIYLFDDYAHHPAEIKATIDAAKERFKNRRLIIIFQPHTYSRTKSLRAEFGKSLSLANFSLLLPIFPSARENPAEFKISTKDIITKLISDRVFSFYSKDELLNKLSSLLKPGDVIFTMGAGDVYKLKDDIIKIISKLKCQNSKL